MDLHRNLFYGYRGPIIADNADRDPQLENNVTRALINTLELGGKAVWRPFLAALGFANVEEVKFLLQRHDLPSGFAAHKPKRVLLGISKKKSHWSPDMGAEGTNKSVPDAWVYGDKFAILVESKANNADFSRGQMLCHYELLCSSEQKPPKVILKTWLDICRLFRQQLPNLVGGARLLVEQFVKFLEYSDMSGFTGFRPEHFNYFVLHDDNDARHWIRHQVRDFAEHIQMQLRKVDAEFYEGYDVGNLKPSALHCWVAFGPAGDRYRKVTHQSLSLSANGLNVFVNTELKSATTRLKAVLRNSADELRAALRKLHVFMPFEIVLEEKKLVRPRVCKETLKMRLHSSLLAEKQTGQADSSDFPWIAFTKTLQRLPLPYMHIDRFVPPSELSDRGANAAVQQVVNILKHNHAVVKLLNQG
jgi:hypothetical protein